MMLLMMLLDTRNTCYILFLYVYHQRDYILSSPNFHRTISRTANNCIVIDNFDVLNGI